MGIDPAASVVNAPHRGQPTCTIQALACRAADQMIGLAMRGEIASGG
jgi:hypothetical protein